MAYQTVIGDLEAAADFILPAFDDFAVLSTVTPLWDPEDAIFDDTTSLAPFLPAIALEVEEQVGKLKSALFDILLNSTHPYHLPQSSNLSLLPRSRHSSSPSSSPAVVDATFANFAPFTIASAAGRTFASLRSFATYAFMAMSTEASPSGSTPVSCQRGIEWPSANSKSSKRSCAALASRTPRCEGGDGRTRERVRLLLL